MVLKWVRRWKLLILWNQGMYDFGQSPDKCFILVLKVHTTMKLLSIGTDRPEQTV